MTRTNARRIPSDWGAAEAAVFLCTRRREITSIIGLNPASGVSYTSETSNFIYLPKNDLHINILEIAQFMPLLTCVGMTPPIKGIVAVIASDGCLWIPADSWVHFGLFRKTAIALGEFDL